jgi:hypothetical protein
VEVVGDSLDYHHKFEIGGGFIHHCRIGVQSSIAVVTITAASGFDLTTICGIPPTVWQLV